MQGRNHELVIYDMTAKDVISVGSIDTLGTDMTGNMLMYRYNVFQYRSIAAGHWSQTLQRLMTLN